MSLSIDAPCYREASRRCLSAWPALNMTAANSETNRAQGFATTALLWLELLALAIGVLQFAFAPRTVDKPFIAAIALALLSLSIVTVFLWQGIGYFRRTERTFADLI